jgi:hypothetical protein
MRRADEGGADDLRRAVADASGGQPNQSRHAVLIHRREDRLGRADAHGITTLSRPEGTQDSVVPSHHRGDVRLRSGLALANPDARERQLRRGGVSDQCGNRVARRRGLLAQVAACGPRAT